MFRTALFHTLLVFALLFAQQGVMAHGMSHLIAAQSHDQSLPHDTQCELCAAYAQMGSAVSSNDVPPAVASAIVETSPAFTNTYRTTHFTSFAARAPPYSV